MNSDVFFSDTIALKIEIERKKELLYIYEMKLVEKGVSCEELFKQIVSLEEELKSKNELLMRARLLKKFPHYIVLHLEN